MIGTAGNACRTEEDMSDVDNAITRLAGYGLYTGLIEEDDIIYTVNQILMNLEKDSYEGSREEVIAYASTLNEERIAAGTELEETLRELTDDAVSRGLTGGDSIVYRDLFDTRLMGCLTPRPSEVIRRFRKLYEDSPVKATDWYYDFSRNTDYIRRYRIAKDMKWKVPTEYGDLDITINLSKPEKDPKAIAAAKNAKQSGYPKCQLCRENEGYAGRPDHPARENHRVIPVTIQNSDWCFQ
jgi:UDPglucose--hexose-1-phosphate uridylyltransferase